MTAKDMLWAAAIAAAVIYLTYHISFLKTIFYA